MWLVSILLALIAIISPVRLMAQDTVVSVLKPSWPSSDSVEESGNMSNHLKLREPMPSDTPVTPAVNWVNVRAHHGVTLRLPAYWRIQGEPENVRQEARANTIIDLTGLSQQNAALVLQASATNAGITVSIISGDFADQATVSSLTPARLVSVNSDFRSDLEAVIQVEGAELLEYRGTSKEKVGSLWSLVTRYTYNMPGHAPLDMESHRIFLGTKSLGIMLQATVGAPNEMTEIFKAIKQSFRISTPD